eukprot:TRINITY_DN28728_c0_g1_i1.p1 TRINITY_DN28728_c0_g1~~TRINITY_DN28728_c0_g1_i1.p1  ORF type:complete len:335 (-),score=38.35 TRINITY_DN28728_c0_g1_i1:254-1258(-)
MLRSLVGSEMCIRDRYQRRVRGPNVIAHVQGTLPLLLAETPADDAASESALCLLSRTCRQFHEACRLPLHRRWALPSGRSNGRARLFLCRNRRLGERELPPGVELVSSSEEEPSTHQGVATPFGLGFNSLQPVTDEEAEEPEQDADGLVPLEEFLRRHGREPSLPQARHLDVIDICVHDYRLADYYLIVLHEGQLAVCSFRGDAGRVLPAAAWPAIETHGPRYFGVHFPSYSWHLSEVSQASRMWERWVGSRNHPEHQLYVNSDLSCDWERLDAQQLWDCVLEIEPRKSKRYHREEDEESCEEEEDDEDENEYWQERFSADPYTDPIGWGRDLD